MALPFSSREQLHDIIFGTNTPAGRRFDMIVTWLIVVSVTAIILQSVSRFGDRYPFFFNTVEWIFTSLFTLEYALRVYAAHDRRRYVTSFFGITDLLSILPSYVGLCIPGQQSLLIIRILRLLRIFRIFGMGHFVSEGAVVASALKASRIKITVFLSFVSISSVLMGSLMYMAEKDFNTQIQNIPEGIYWAIVTITTVGYGDAIPVTDLGKMLASVVMILGYGVIAVPTGIVTAEITNRVLARQEASDITCPECGNKTHLKHALFCQRCGESLS